MTSEREPWGQIVAKAWQDESFKKRLLAEPAAVFKEFGVAVSPSIQVRVVENTDTRVYLTIPAKPHEAELSDAELEGVAGGSTLGRIIARGLGLPPSQWGSPSSGKQINDLANKAGTSQTPSQQAASGAGGTPSQGGGIT